MSKCPKCEVRLWRLWRWEIYRNSVYNFRNSGRLGVENHEDSVQQICSHPFACNCTLLALVWWWFVWCVAASFFHLCPCYFLVQTSDVIWCNLRIHESSWSVSSIEVFLVLGLFDISTMSFSLTTCVLVALCASGQADRPGVLTEVSQRAVKHCEDDVLQSMESKMGSERKDWIESQSAIFEAALRPLFTVLPHTIPGRLNPEMARYALHRVFVDARGWNVNGLEESNLYNDGSTFPLQSCWVALSFCV